jgi:iron complex outermembrane receptor protein
VDVNGFFNHYDNLQGAVEGAPSPNPGPPPYLLVPLSISNNLYGHSYGTELAANWNVTDRWRLSGSYTWLQLDIHHSRPDPLGQAAFDNHGSPHNQFQVHSYLDVLKNVQLNAGAYYVERIAGVPSYIRMDVSVVWRPVDGLEVSVGVQNLLDNRHPEFADYRVINVPSEVPRTFYGELTWRY